MHKETCCGFEKKIRKEAEIDGESYTTFTTKYNNYAVPKGSDLEADILQRIWYSVPTEYIGGPHLLTQELSLDLTAVS